MSSETVRGGSRRWLGADGLHLDVRGLECPEPMVAILALIDGIDPPDTLLVHIDQDPVFLYPELAERGWVIQPVPQGPGDEAVCLRLVRLGV